MSIGSITNIAVLLKAKNLSFVLDSPLKVKYEDRPVPELKDPHDVIVQVAWTGICGSDVSTLLWLAL